MYIALLAIQSAWIPGRSYYPILYGGKCLDLYYQININARSGVFQQELLVVTLQLKPEIEIRT